MTVLVGIDALSPPEGGSAVTIGTFDGVHLGHRALIASTAARAGEAGLSPVVVTWDRHPMTVVKPAAAPRAVCTPERKIELLEETGAEMVCVLPFTEEFSTWPPERFVERVLVEGLSARLVVVGQGWRFGHRAAGDVALLERLGERRGFTVTTLAHVGRSGGRVSSTRVRRAVAEGDMRLAEELLGRPFDLDGIVLRGDQRGRRLGFPTANVDMDPSLVAPPLGVYAGRARARGFWYPAAVNVGVNPTFGGDPATTPAKVEAYFLGFDDDIYGEEIRVELWARLRDELKFDSVEDLIEQMHRDVEETKRITC
ncbi:MAG TPA: bifunctional riboflavin kinase/FAD synthetase [Actinomycetota bacterium]|nr:bifunctional riboflavin kinase/FAD synthetase [Actinomycetota bacterium]